jgi:cation diffusion facilitator family transporter
MQEYSNLKKGEIGAWISIGVYLFISALKLIIAYIGDSEGLRADGLNNATDVVASIAILIGIRISRKPPDQNHHYGHFRAESIASLVAAFIMISVGVDVIIDAFSSILKSTPVTPSMLTAYTALFSAFIMLLVYRYNIKLAKITKSPSIYAQSQDNLSDALVSIGVFVGIIGSQFGLIWLDPFAGLIVGLIICKTAFDIFKDASQTLTDGFDSKELKLIKKSIEEVDGVRAVKDIKARRHGNQILIETTILVNPHLTVEKSHGICDNVEKHLEEKFEIKHTHVHIEPF